MVVNEKKSGKLRICVDPKDLNKHVKREYYQLPTQEDITCRLAGVKYFSKLDANQGFWQIPLDNESSYLTILLMADTALLLFRLASILHKKYSTELLMTNLLTFQGASLILMTFWLCERH